MVTEQQTRYEYLKQYLGKPIVINWNTRYIEGTLSKIDPFQGVALLLPSIVYGSNKSLYLEKEVPTAIALNLLDMQRCDCVIQPLRSLEEIVSSHKELNAPKSKLGF
jgi:hypothetical protein